MKFNEQFTVENYIIEFLQKDLGYEYVPPQKFAKLREFENEYIIAPLFLAAIKKINGIADDADGDAEAQAVLREVQKIDNNQEFLHALRYGVIL